MRRPRFAFLAASLLILRCPVFCDTISAVVSDVRLTATSGSVQVEAKGPKDRKVLGPPPIYSPLLLQDGDIVRTARGSSAEIAFAEGTLLHLHENSALHIRQILPKSTLLTLYYGTLLAKVEFEKNEGQVFAVNTPSARATVTGTEFVVEESGGLSHIAVLDEGHVTVTARGYKKQVVMHFNQETQVKQGLPPRDAHVLERMYHYKIEMGDMRAHLKAVHKDWKKFTAEQLSRLRAAWIHQHGKKHHPHHKR
jgi:hypothetical protein